VIVLDDDDEDVPKKQEIKTEQTLSHPFVVPVIINNSHQ
jgi:hypothetical protein